MCIRDRLESEVTAFLLNENNLREESVRDFAQSAIEQYGEMAQSLRRAVSLQQQLNTLRNAPPQFHNGGYVDGRGGEVHAGEYVIPQDLVGRFSGLVSDIERVRQGGSGIVDNRTVNAPITVNANIAENIDINEIGRSFKYELDNLR